MKSLKIMIAIAVVVLHLVSHYVQAGDVVSDKESLRGIKTIEVTIGKISHDAKKMGINRDALKRVLS